MKKILILLGLFISLVAHAQVPPGYTNISARYDWLAGKFRALHIPAFNTTPSLTTGQWIGAGAVGIDSVLHRQFFYSGGSWRRLANFSEIASSCVGLKSGGRTVWDSLLVFTISAAEYCIDNDSYTSPLTHLTLGAADVTNPRIDVFALTTSGTVIAIPGTPAANPAKPYVAPDQLEIGFVQIPANATEASIVVTTIYDENTEWTGAATSVTTNFAQTSQFYHLTKSTDAGAVTAASSIKYTTATPIKISQYNVLRFFVRLKASFATTCRFQLSWLSGASTVSTTVNITSGSYGFLRSLTGSWQEIIIPMSDFSFFQDSVDAIKFQLTGTNGSGFYLDWIQIQGGVQDAGKKYRFAVSGEDAVASQHRYFNGKNTYTFWLDSLLDYTSTAGAYRLKNISGSDFLRYTPSGLLLDPLSISIPLTINNLPASDTATYVLGITTGNRAVRQNKSAFSSVNIYNSDGTIADALRTVDVNNNTLFFDDAGGIEMLTRTTGGHFGGLSISPTTSSLYVDTSFVRAEGNYVKMGFTNGKNIYIDGLGRLRANQYGVGSWENPFTYLIGVNASGDFVEIDTTGLFSGGGGGSTPTLQQVLTAGSTLTSNNTIDANGTLFKIIQNHATRPGLQIEQSGIGNGLVVTGAGNPVIKATNSIDAVAIDALSEGGITATLDNRNATTTTVLPALALERLLSSGTAANGIGISILFNAPTTSNPTTLANELISKWTNATHASRISQFIITGVNSGSSVDMLTLGAEGYVKPQNITATAASAITAADGMLVYVTNTNGTFTSVGFWGYENGAWVKL